MAGLRWGRGALALGLAALSAACYEHTFTVGRGAPAGTVVYEHWQNHWLGGLIGEETVDVAALCPSGNATIHDEQTFLNGLVAALTSGIYTPTQVTVRCASGRRTEVELPAATLVGLVRHPAFLDRVERVLPARYDEAVAAAQAFADRD